MPSLRFDFSDSLGAPRYLSDGSALIKGRAARTGDHHYSWGVERRDQAELESVIRQLPGKPVTIDHPATMISNGGQAPIGGSVKGAALRNDHAEVELHLSQAGLSAMRAGRRELSLGYETDAVGGRQTNTRVDHLALVRSGRCGPSCSVRTDCSGESACGCEPARPMTEVLASRFLTALYAGV